MADGISEKATLDSSYHIFVDLPKCLGLLRRQLFVLLFTEYHFVSQPSNERCLLAKLLDSSYWTCWPSICWKVALLPFLRCRFGLEWLPANPEKSFLVHSLLFPHIPTPHLP